MTVINDNYALSTDQYGMAVIEITGRCTADEVAAVEGNCTRKYVMVPLPAAEGAILKALDGSAPSVVDVKPSTINKTFRCVKVDGRVNPFAPTQTGGTYSGSAVLAFRMLYQETGDPA